MLFTEEVNKKSTKPATETLRDMTLTDNIWKADLISQINTLFVVITLYDG